MLSSNRKQQFLIVLIFTFSIYHTQTNTTTLLKKSPALTSLLNYIIGSCHKSSPELLNSENLVRPKVYLLIGKSNTSKVFFIEALQHEIKSITALNHDKFKYFEVNGAQLTDAHNKAYKILAYAKKIPDPCIVFIHNIDLAYKQRKNKNQTLYDFLTFFNDLINDKDQTKPVFLIASTNNQEAIDAALRDPTSFEFIISTIHTQKRQKSLVNNHQ